MQGGGLGVRDTGHGQDACRLFVLGIFGIANGSGVSWVFKGGSWKLGNEMYFFPIILFGLVIKIDL